MKSTWRLSAGPRTEPAEESETTRWVLRGLVPPKRARFGILAFAILAAPTIGYADYVTGGETSFSLFYLIPVLPISWTFGSRYGAAMAAMCALSGFVANWTLPSYGSWPLFVWNATSRCTLLVVTGYLTAAIHGALKDRTDLAKRLEEARSEVKTLEGLLPICAWCKRIHDEEASGKWEQIEQYIAKRSDATFTHGICHDCTARLVAEGRGQFS
jgi:hypothetical protein